MLDKWFQLKQRGSSVGVEALAGVTTWITMVYIAAVNPGILSEAGMDFGAVFVATCLAAAIGTALMGILANHPLALAPGMGLNAFFVYSIVLGAGYTWQAALGAVFWSGVIFIILSISPIRRRVINDMPESLKTGATVGIGLFLAVIGLQNARIIEAGEGTLLTLGKVKSLPFILSCLGLILIAALHARKKPWAVIAGIGVVTALGWAFDDNAHMPATFMSMPPSIAPTFLKLEWVPSFDFVFLSLVLSLLFVDFFDTSGALIAVAKRGGFIDEKGQVIRVEKALLADSSATVIGSLLGTSTTTTYIESNAGVSVGGKTGLTSIFVSALFLLTLFFSPLAASIPSYATAPALIFVSMLLIISIRDFQDWENIAEFAPLVLTAVMMPLSFSIADGLAMGCISYTLIHVVSGQWKKLNGVTWALTAAFLLRFVFFYQ